MILLWNGFAKKIELWKSDEGAARQAAEYYMNTNNDVIYFFAAEVDELIHTVDTLRKVYVALEELGMDQATSIDVVSSILNKGVLFRERA